MNRERILLVEDEQDIQELLKFHLEHEGFAVIAAKTGEEALDAVSTQKFNLILLDLMLPDINGSDVCRRLKANPETSEIPIIMLTAKDSEADIIAGLEMGAADYITKPFSPRVLVARIHAALRRPDSNPTDNNMAALINIGPLTIDSNRHKVEIKNKEVLLTCTEFRILQILADSPGRAFSRKYIVNQIHGESYAVTERIIDVQMVSLRKKLGKLGDWIETVRGIGYRFKEV